jgi:hypothetical protein
MTGAERMATEGEGARIGRLAPAPAATAGEAD